MLVTDGKFVVLVDVPVDACQQSERFLVHTALTVTFVESGQFPVFVGYLFGYVGCQVFAGISRIDA